MKSIIKPGLTHEFKFMVPENKTVPHLYPESPEFQVMPKVLATGFLVGLCEWTCIQAINPYLDWPHEQTVGIEVRLNHTAATPPGFIVTVKAKLEKVDGRKLTFSIIAKDDTEIISEGTHVRFIIDNAKFNDKIRNKIKSKS
jgi:fluoroacetyl-CoA thioesterase